MAVADMDDDELLDALGVEVAPIRSSSRSPREERIIAGFEEIQRFVEKNKRIPEHGESRDIFERLYAVRLDRLRSVPECRVLLESMDGQGLLTNMVRESGASFELDDDALLSELGADSASNSITELKHVRSSAEKREADEIARRTPCRNFERFKPLFEQVTAELKSGVRQTRLFGKDGSIEIGNYFIVNGQIAYVAEIGEYFKAPNGETDARMQVIFSNATESNLLMRSLQRALYKDEAGRRITDPDAGPLFSQQTEPDDIASGTIYVLRSLSDHPYIAKYRDLVHKIGVTGGKVETRIAAAATDATYLLANVEVVATYKLSNVNRSKLEGLFHRIFASAQIDLTIQDRFGNPVKPREWFLVPLPVIDEAVKRIVDGSITAVVYDPQMARLAKT